VAYFLSDIASVKCDDCEYLLACGAEGAVDNFLYLAVLHFARMRHYDIKN